MTLRARLHVTSLIAVVAVIVSILAFTDDITFGELFAPAFIALLIVLIISSAMSTMVVTRIRELAQVARALASGSTAVRPPLGGSDEVAELATALGRLAEHIASSTDRSRQDDALLGSVIEALDEGVVHVSRRRQVTRINPAAREILGLNLTLPFPAERLPRSREIQAAMERAFAGERSGPVEAVVGTRIVSISGRPIPAEGGVVLAFFDLTGLKRLETVRRDFVANVSHELRTPLTVITGFAETLAEEDPPAEMRQQFASTIRAHAERMQRIVDDLLDLSRLESGRWEPQVEELLLAPIADDISATYRERAAAKQLTIETSIGDGAASVRADPTAVRQVLSNLVDNAVRHTGSGQVTIFSRRQSDGVTIGVRDTGAGIPAVHLSRVFERFYRADHGRGRQEGGTGLGLSIVKHLVEAHGGRVSAESEPGRGTTIEVFFPDR